MSTDVYSVLVKKVKGTSAELQIGCLIDGDQLNLSPTLVLRLLEDPDGSPLQGLRIYDPAWIAENMDRIVERMELLKRAKGGESIVVRVITRDPSWLAHLSKGMSWHSTAYAKSELQLIDGAWSHDAKLALIAGNNGVATLYAVTKKGLGAARGFLNHWGVRAIDIFPDMGGMLTAGGDLVILWDAKGKKETGRFNVDAAITSARCVDPSRILLGCADGSARLVDHSGAELSRAACGSPITAIDVDPSGELAAIGCEDGGVWSWTFSGDPTRRAAHQGPVTDVATRGGQLLSGGQDRRARLFAAGSTSPSAELVHETRSSYGTYNARLSPSGDELLMSAGPKVVAVEPTTGAVTELDPDFDGSIFTYSPSGAYRTVERTGPWELALWDREGALVKRTQLPRLSLHRDSTGTALGHVRFSPDEEHIAIPAQPEDYKELALEIMPVRTKGQVRCPWPESNYDFFNDLDFIDDHRVMIGGANYGHGVYDLSGEELVTSKTRYDCIIVCPDGSGRILVSKDKDVSILGADLEPLKSTRAPIPYSYNTLRWTGDGARVVMATGEGVWVWDLETDELWQAEQSDPVDATPGLSQDGRWMLLQENYDQWTKITLWDLHTRSIAATIPSSRWASVLGFRADSSEVLLCRGDTIERFGLDGAELGKVELGAPAPVEHAISSVALLPDGRALTAALGDPQPSLWTAEGIPRKIRVGYSRMTKALPSPDGARILALCGWQAAVVDRGR